MPENLKWLLPDSVVGTFFLTVHQVSAGVHEMTSNAAAILSMAYFGIRLYRYARRTGEAPKDDPPIT